MFNAGWLAGMRTVNVGASTSIRALMAKSSEIDGPGGRYRGHYSGATLIRWSEQIDRCRSGGSDVFVYFDNDQKSAAPLGAAKLRLI